MARARIGNCLNVFCRHRRTPTYSNSIDITCLFMGYVRNFISIYQHPVRKICIRKQYFVGFFSLLFSLLPPFSSFTLSAAAAQKHVLSLHKIQRKKEEEIKTKRTSPCCTWLKTHHQIRIHFHTTIIFTLV